MKDRDFYRALLRKTLRRLDKAIEADPLPEVCQLHLQFLERLKAEINSADGAEVQALQARIASLELEHADLANRVNPLLAREGVQTIRRTRFGETL